MWKSLTGNAQFSIIACIIFVFLGFFSMGILGFGLYYLIFPISKSLFPHPDSLHGDNVWLVAMYASMLWPFGFIFAAILFHFLKKRGWPTGILYFLYVISLWLWCALLWLFLIKSYFVSSQGVTTRSIEIKSNLFYDISFLKK
ncbi:putative lipoprotein [Leptospira alstonii serovar Pingchang str. 80-412]|uniref:Lipoprotein n=2 Tax=Leptospira alstonii TaxID=28452 RepID=T0G7D5_9LEPT|nr:putative lipoprotein [Leptospira alstonii serovar Sichuan str. 79601]EQA82107.1 putative lipoprotein [Leptospira alstonii serovar Pingchang str. 80-412]